MYSIATSAVKRPKSTCGNRSAVGQPIWSPTSERQPCDHGALTRAGRAGGGCGCDARRVYESEAGGGDRARGAWSAHAGLRLFGVGAGRIRHLSAIEGVAELDPD